MEADIPDANTVIRTLGTTVGGGTSTVWASAVVQPGTNVGGFVQLNAGTNAIEFGFPESSDFSISVTGGGGNWKNTSYSPTVGDTYFLVFEINYGATNTLQMWVDPNITQSYTQWGTNSASGYVMGTTTNSLSPITSAGWMGASTGGSTYWDELRVGTNSSAVTPLAQPSAPATLTATPSGTNIALAWPLSSSGTNLAQGYDIWRSTNGGISYGTSSYITLGPSATGYTDTTVTSGTTYYYEVTAENTTGDSLNSNVVSLGAGGTKPVAPSNLAATPGTSSITLTWTDNSSNETAFNIQRSTTGAAGSWSTVGSTGANITTWIDNATNDPGNAPVSGMSYYYQIDASNGAGSSVYDQLPSDCGLQTVIAYEGFNYPTTSTWNGSTTGGALGVGFTGNWSIANSSNAQIVSGSLTYTATNGASLTTIGNALSLTNNDTATQSLGQSFVYNVTTSSSLWVGFEFKATGSLSVLKIGTGSGSIGDVELGWLSNNLTLSVTTSTGYNNQPAGVTGTANTNYYIVGEIQYFSTSPVVTLWVDPEPNSVYNSSPTGFLGTVTKTIPSTDGDLGSTTALSLLETGASTTATFDEVRLGSTYASVAPDPILTGSSANSGTSSKRRPSRGNPFHSIYGFYADPQTRCIVGRYYSVSQDQRTPFLSGPRRRLLAFDQ